MFGFYRVHAAIPHIKISNVNVNLQNIVKLWEKAEKEHSSLIVFPELCLSGYSCGDLFLQSKLLSSIEDAIDELCNASKSFKSIAIIGAPIRHKARLYNCAIVIQNGCILGVIPKSYLPTYREYYEKRWFFSGKNIKNEILKIKNHEAFFGTNLIFEMDKFFSFAVEICEDLWNAIPPSSYYAIAGATIIANLSASHELVGKAIYRKKLIENQSARCLSAYIYSSSGYGESSTDLVYGGHSIICENGIIINESKRFIREDILISADIDCEKLVMLRLKETTHGDNLIPDIKTIPLQKTSPIPNIQRHFNSHPFIPEDPITIDNNCAEIFNIQCTSLIQRLEHTKIKKVVIGISGGLDSALAVLIAYESFKRLKLKSNNIITLILPGFGTSQTTYNNARILCTSLNTSIIEIDIKESCQSHLKDINYDTKALDNTFENSQARERTQILMDIANKENAIVIGTSDLSELALGWTTFGGDHMSMYNVNAGVPKTLVKTIISWILKQPDFQHLNLVLNNILNTPISPELLPSDHSNINQKTEEQIGPYELHDFFLFHFIRFGASFNKIKHIASLAFKHKYSLNEIDKWLKVFFKRFFTQQFKRNCIPDGPKIGLVSLSPRGDWKMPSDADYEQWIR